MSTLVDLERINLLARLHADLKLARLELTSYRLNRVDAKSLSIQEEYIETLEGLIAQLQS